MGKELDLVVVSTDAEHKLIGSLLLGVSILKNLPIRLSIRHFSDRRTQLIFTAIKDIEDRGDSPSFISVSDYLKSRDLLTSIGGNVFLEDLIEFVTRDPSEVDEFCNILEEKLIQRDLLNVTSKISAKIANQDFKSLDHLLQDCIGEISAIREVSGGSSRIEIIGPGDIYERRKLGLKLRENSDRLLTGFPIIDRHISRGFAAPGISVTAGRPGMGKSTWKSNVIMNLCEEKVGVISFSPEQGFDQEADRNDALITGIPLMDLIRWGDPSIWDKDDPETRDRIIRLREANKRYDDEWNLYYVPNRMLSIKDVEPVLVSCMSRAEKAGNEIKVAFIDLFDWFSEISSETRNKANEIGKCLRIIGSLSQRYNIHFNLVHQLNRQVENRKNPRPCLSDLRDSGMMEQDAMMVIFVDREKVRDPTVVSDMMEVIIGKQRDGPVGISEFFMMDQSTLRLSEVEQMDILGVDAFMGV